jgi:hypothetical protein
LKTFTRALAAASAIGVLLSGWGFAQWHMHVQYYADRQAKAEFEDNMAELALKRRDRDNACWKEQHTNPPVAVSSACPFY